MYTIVAIRKYEYYSMQIPWVVGHGYLLVMAMCHSMYLS
jgi:hypothetical protein